MQKEILNKISKFALIGIILIMIITLPVLATDNVEENENIDEEIVNEEENVEEESEEEDATSNQSTQASDDNRIPTKQISSYSTISTLPEANLGLNNILNVILIAVGVIIILLAIAILIRLK